MLSHAETSSTELRRVANEYVDDAMQRTEEALTSALDEIRQSRQSFRQAARAAGEPPPSAPPTEPPTQPQIQTQEIDFDLD